MKKISRLSFWKFLVYYPLGEFSENPVLIYISHRFCYDLPRTQFWKFLEFGRILFIISPEFGRILFIISIGTLIHKNIEKLYTKILKKISRLSFWKFLVYYPLGEFSENPVLFILAPILLWSAPNLVESFL